jgi:hypothetical protein
MNGIYHARVLNVCDVYVCDRDFTEKRVCSAGACGDASYRMC